MSYPAEIRTAARAALAERRRRADAKTEQNRALVFAKVPQAQQLEREIASASAMLSRAILSGGDITEKVNHIRDVNLEGQKKLAALLKANGFAEDALQDVVVCPNCHDTGVTADGAVCSCLHELERSIAMEQLGADANDTAKGFDSFDLSLYGVQERPVMQKILSACRTYAQSFSPASGNLLLIGRPGLGKTHLSLAIGFAVVEKGFFVCYTPFHRLFSRLEEARFGHGEEETARVMKEPLSCDLLILDDLGSEMASSFAASVLYEIINTRLVEGRPTIISTNLTEREITDRYQERVYSRLFGSYRKLPFVGDDIRLKKSTQR
jgi:DNA replication protein DnaC